MAYLFCHGIEFSPESVISRKVHNVGGDKDNFKLGSCGFDYRFKGDVH
jgi:hypothetical protein